MTDVPPEAAAARLTGLLRGAGVFERGEVADLAVETSRDTLVSRITRLRLTYDVAVTPGPSHAFVRSQRDGNLRQHDQVRDLGQTGRSLVVVESCQ